MTAPEVTRYLVIGLVWLAAMWRAHSKTALEVRALRAEIADVKADHRACTSRLEALAREFAKATSPDPGGGALHHVGTRSDDTGQHRRKKPT
jgi:hypothetical protein